MTKSMKKAIALCLFSMGVVGLMAQSNEFKIDVQKTGAPIQSTMYGIFFEDINYGADGGLYAELVKNRSFEFENPFGGWTPFGNVSVQTQKPCFDRNPHYVRLSYEKELTGTGLDNEGFNGIGIREGEKYDFSLYARTRSGDAPVKLRINLVDSRNDLYEQKEIEVSGKEWKKYTVVLTPGATEARSRLRITMVTKGIVDLEHISLFPQKTFNNRPNGMRADLAQALKELKPGVFRFSRRLPLWRERTRLPATSGKTRSVRSRTVRSISIDGTIHSRTKSFRIIISPAAWAFSNISY